MNSGSRNAAESRWGAQRTIYFQFIHAQVISFKRFGRPHVSLPVFSFFVSNGEFRSIGLNEKTPQITCLIITQIHIIPDKQASVRETTTSQRQVRFHSYFHFGILPLFVPCIFRCENTGKRKGRRRHRDELIFWTRKC